MRKIQILVWLFPVILLANVDIGLRHVGNNPDVHFFIRLIYLSVISPFIFVVGGVLLWLVFSEKLEYEYGLERIFARRVLPVTYVLCVPSLFYNMFLIYSIVH